MTVTLGLRGSTVVSKIPLKKTFVAADGEPMAAALRCLTHGAFRVATGDSEHVSGSLLFILKILHS